MILAALLFALLFQPPPPIDAQATVRAAEAQATWSVDYATAMAPTYTPQPPTPTATPIPTVTPTPTATPRPSATPADTATPPATWTPQVPIIIVPTVVVMQQAQGEKVERWPDWVIAVAFGVSVLLIAGGAWLYFKWRRV